MTCLLPIGRGRPFSRRAVLNLGVSTCILLGACVTQTARAETPVNMCSDAGMSSGMTGGSGTGFQPELGDATRPLVATDTNFGHVNPRTGAFSYSHEDISLGTGDFPTRLSLNRTYSSDLDGPIGIGVVPLVPYMPGSLKWYAFGRGATHDLDVTIAEEPQSFAGKSHIVVTLRKGFQTESFQRCLNGQYRSTTRSGARLFDDATYPAGGYRYEGRDGSVLLFEKTVRPSSSDYVCGSTPSISRACGVLRKWAAPNGDWAEFEDELFYSHPTNRADPGWSGGLLTNWMYNSTTTQCFPDFSGQSECHSVIHPSYYTTSGQQYSPIPSYAVYDRRLMRVFNSRGYELRFSYVDESTDKGGTCSTPGTGLACTPPKNVSLGRNRLMSVSGYWVSPGGQSSQLGTVTYGYSDCLQSGSGADCLNLVRRVDGSIIQIKRTTDTLAMHLPDQSEPPITVKFVKAPLYGYYPDRPRGYYASNPKQIREYFRVATQTFADGRSATYEPTFADRWVAEPSGTWARVPYVASMRITESGRGVTTLGYVDQADEHSAPVTIVDALGRTTANNYNAVGALLGTTFPEKNRVEYEYDVRGNLVATTWLPKPGNGGSALRESTAFLGGTATDANECVNQRLCNRPDSRTDKRQNTTNYTWDARTGLLTAVTGPADANGVRPKTTYNYESFVAAGSTPITLLKSKTEKIDSSRSFVTRYGYGADYRLPLTESLEEADGQSRRTCFGYDAVGNKISETKPRAGLAACQ